MYENTHYITPHKKNRFFLNIYFPFKHSTSAFIAFEVRGIFYFLMASYLHKKFQTINSIVYGLWRSSSVRTKSKPKVGNITVKLGGFCFLVKNRKEFM